MPQRSRVVNRRLTSQQAIARIENGGVMPAIDSLAHIGSALGVDLVVRFESPHEGAAPT